MGNNYVRKIFSIHNAATTQFQSGLDLCSVVLPMTIYQKWWTSFVPQVSSKPYDNMFSQPWIFILALCIQENFKKSNNQIYTNFFQVQFQMGQSMHEMDQVTFLKGCLPQILVGPILNTLSQIY